MEKITLSISAQTLNTIGAMLREGPYKLVQPAILELDQQVAEYLRKKNGSENLRPADSNTGGTDESGA